MTKNDKIKTEEGGEIATGASSLCDAVQKSLTLRRFFSMKPKSETMFFEGTKQITNASKHYGKKNDKYVKLDDAVCSSTELGYLSRKLTRSYTRMRAHGNTYKYQVYIYTHTRISDK